MSELTMGEWIRRALAVEYRGERSGVRRGALPLAAHQARAVERGLQMARRFGGVLIADDVGLGKTRVAIAIADALARDQRKASRSPARVRCIAPARLRAQWRAASERSGLVEIDFYSHTALSRRGAPDGDRGVIIVDEAHRFRNPTTRRSRALASLARDAWVVMLSATPICNSIWDLYHLLRIFCAEEDTRPLVGLDLREAFVQAQAGCFDLTEVLRHLVIRRRAADAASARFRRPGVHLEVLSYDASEREAWLWEHLEAEVASLKLSLLEPDWPRGLFQEFILKRWESGARSLSRSLEAVLEFHRRWLQARSQGRRLSREEFRALFDGPSRRRQEVFPFLLAPKACAEPDPARVEQDVRDDMLRLERVHRRAAYLAAQGDGRAHAVVDLAARLSGKLLVFASYQSAAEELFEALRRRLGPRARLAIVTGRGARATGLGAARSDDILQRFAPIAHGRVALPEHQQIRILVATDCLSEGVNLQDCAHVVLADLPYSPRAIEQRIGRLARPGAAGDTVRVYLPRPRNWADSLGLRRRLSAKMDAARQSGASFEVSRHLWASSGGDARAPRSGPLSALTRLDRLAHVIGAAEADPLPAGGFEVVAPDLPRSCETLWTRFALRVGSHRRFGWLCATPTAGVEARLEACLPGLVAGAESDALLRASRRDTPLARASDQWLAQRARCLRAARAAPTQAAMGGPATQLWRMIYDGARGGEVRVEEATLRRLRAALLRSHPRGVQRRLARLVSRSPSPQEALRAAMELPARASGVADGVAVDVLGRLWVPGAGRG